MNRPGTPLNEAIRKHVYRIITTGKSGDRLPTEKELCELFGVARGTVRSVLKRFIEEGSVIALKGSGMYIAKPAEMYPGSLLVGIAVGDGRQAYFTYYPGMITSGASRELCLSGHTYDFLENPRESDNWADVLSQIRQSGLLWALPQVKGLKTLAKNKVPTVALGVCLDRDRQCPAPPPFVNGVFLDEYHEGAMFVKHGLAAGQKKLLVVRSPQMDSPLFLKGVHDAMAESKLDKTEHLRTLAPSQVSQETIEKAVLDGFTGIYCDHRRLLFAHKIIKGMGGAHGRTCRLLARHHYLKTRYPELEFDVIDCHLDEIGRQGVRLLLDTIGAPDSEPRHSYVKPTIEKHGN